MRLVDLNKVKWKEGFYDMQTGEQYAPMLFKTDDWLEWATAEAEVEAIPVEFLNKKVEEYIELGLNSVAKELNVIIDEWRDENGNHSKCKGS